jgi:hypothetical protein
MFALIAHHMFLYPANPYMFLPIVHHAFWYPSNDERSINAPNSFRCLGQLFDIMTLRFDSLRDCKPSPVRQATNIHK